MAQVDGSSKFVKSFEWLISPEGPHHKASVAWAGDNSSNESGYNKNLYHLCTDKTLLTPDKSADEYPLLVNHSKGCFIDKRKSAAKDCHPLALLTLDTDAGGGGMYQGINEDRMGEWARDVISVEATAPEGFKEVKIKFSEDEE